MKVVIIKKFEGHPAGDDKPGTVYIAGAEPVELPDEFVTGAKLIEKGLVQGVVTADVHAAPEAPHAA